MMAALVCCGGGAGTPITGGTPSPTPKLPPISVRASSYFNAKTTGLGPQSIASVVQAGWAAYAFADFFQEGSYSLFSATIEYDPKDPATYARRGHLKFYQQVSGVWADRTSALLADNTGCLHARKAAVADFNGDGRPDVFLACHGIDAPPFAGESPMVVLSQPGGGYRAISLPVTCFCHSAAAAELRSPGFADVVVTDGAAHDKPFFLLNNHDGTFAADETRLPRQLVAGKMIFTAELLDLSGRGFYDLLLAGNEPNTVDAGGRSTPGEFPTTVFLNDGTGHFDAASSIQLPGDLEHGFALDAVLAAGALYLLRTIDTNGANFYGGMAIQKIDLATLSGREIYSHSGPYAGGVTWFPWVVPVGGTLVSLDASFPVVVSMQ
jgi:hypothetical protein